PACGSSTWTGPGRTRARRCARPISPAGAGTSSRPERTLARAGGDLVEWPHTPPRRSGMSVIMTLRANGDPKALEERAAADPDAIRAISDGAKRHGLIAHRFYGSQDGIMVVDEWPDEASFH